MTPAGEPGPDGVSYAAMLRATVARDPDAVALVFPESSTTYGDLLERASWRARELRALGVRAGETFGLLLPNCPEMVELVVGGALIGAIAVPVNTRYKSFEVEHICRSARLRALITTDAIEEYTDLKGVLYQTLPDLREASDARHLTLSEFPDLEAVAVLGAPAAGMVDGGSLRLLAESEEAPVEADAPSPDAPILIMYTSGTTASAKGCVIANNALVANAEAIADRFEIPADDRWWDPLPMFHMGALLLMSAVFSRGATFISMGHLDAGEAIDLIEQNRPTVLYPLFPTITMELLHHERFAAIPQEPVRVICNVSPRDIQLRVQDAFPEATLISAYGMTELCGSAAYSRLDDTLKQRTTTCGHLLPSFEARIVDPESNEPVAPDVRGELVARGPHIFRGYFGAPDLTAESIDADGWFHTGDLCSIDVDGLLSFHGRIKDQLKVGGENVSALEVESFLATHPAIKLAQVVGVPDPRYVEVAAAFVELAPGATLDEADVVEFCEGRIARFKIPAHVRFVDEWPMSSTKIQKFRLRERLIEELGVGATRSS